MHKYDSLSCATEMRMEPEPLTIKMQRGIETIVYRRNPGMNVVFRAAESLTKVMFRV